MSEELANDTDNNISMSTCTSLHHTRTSEACTSGACTVTCTNTDTCNSVVIKKFGNL